MTKNTPKDNEPPVALKGEATEKQIAEWKKKYGDRIFAVQSLVNGETLIAYFHKPDRTQMKFLATKAGNFVEFNQALFENCWLGGAEEFKTDEDLYLATCQRLDMLTKFAEVELKKI